MDGLIKQMAEALPADPRAWLAAQLDTDLAGPVVAAPLCCSLCQGSDRHLAAELLALIDTANAPIFGVDTDLLITEWNQKAAQITGYSKEEVLGKPLVDTYITAEYKDPVRSVLTAAATGGQQAASYEFPLYTKTGERRELLLNATS